MPWNRFTRHDGRELQAKTAELRNGLSGETLDDLLPKAFAAGGAAGGGLAVFRHENFPLCPLLAGSFFNRAGSPDETGEGKTPGGRLPAISMPWRLGVSHRQV
jgi:preprotein translocase subunit SecA